MKNLFTLIILILSFNCFSQTQAEMNKEAYAEFNKSDQQLNEIYQRILLEYKSDSIFVENLRKSQRLWVQFRDAEMEMKYPNYKDENYGSIHPTCRAYYLKELTDKRINTLKEWIVGTEEGDVCNGSVKMIEDIKSEVETDTTINNIDVPENLINTKTDEKLLFVGECINESYKVILKERIETDSNAFVMIIEFNNQFIRVDTLNLRPSLTRIENCTNNYVLLQSACGGPCYLGTFVFIDSTRPTEDYMYYHVSSSNENIITHIENEEFEKLIIRNLENGKEMSVNIANCKDLERFPCEIFEVKDEGSTLILTYDSSSDNPKKKVVNISSILK